jgi:hypothetical protein
MITIDKRELETFLFCTIRYALGRPSYITLRATLLIRKYHRYCYPDVTKCLIDDIERTKPEERGMEMDQKLWAELLEELKKSLTIPWEENPHG